MPSLKPRAAQIPQPRSPGALQRSAAGHQGGGNLWSQASCSKHLDQAPPADHPGLLARASHSRCVAVTHGVLFMRTLNGYHQRRTRADHEAGARLITWSRACRRRNAVLKGAHLIDELAEGPNPTVTGVGGA